MVANNIKHNDFVIGRMLLNIAAKDGKIKFLDVEALQFEAFSDDPERDAWVRTVSHNF